MRRTTRQSRCAAHPRNRAALRLETLEARENPATVTWLPTTGGYWSNPLNWSTGMLPGPADIAVINLPATETVFILGTGSSEIEVQAVRSTGSLVVGGTLRATSKSIVSGALDVAETGTLNIGVWVTSPPPGGGGSPPTSPPPLGGGGTGGTGGGAGGGPGASYPPDMDGPFPTDPDSMEPLAGLIASGGGTIAGTIGNEGEVYFTGGHFYLAGTGKLDRTGWYGVQTELTLEDSDATVHNFSVITGGVVDGDPNLTVSDTFISAGGTFMSTASSAVIVNGYGYVLAPVPAGPQSYAAIYDRKGAIIAEGKTEKIAGDVLLKNGAVYENNGTIQITAISTIDAGPGGGGSVNNKGVWQLQAAGFTSKVPFTNRGQLIGDNAALGGGRTLTLPDFTQVGLGEGTESPFVSLNKGAQLKLGKASVQAGFINSEAVNQEGDLPPIRGLVSLDSGLLGPSDAAKLSFEPLDSDEVGLNGVEFIADAKSEITIQAPANPGILPPVKSVKFIGSDMTLNGHTIWQAGDIQAFGSEVTNNGNFEIKYGDHLDTGVVGNFVNTGIVQKTTTNPFNPTPSIIGGMFVNMAQARVAVTSGELRFGKTVFAGMLDTSPDTKVTFYADNAYSALATLAAESEVAFIGGQTTFLAAGKFQGAGWVSVWQPASWQIPQGMTVEVSHLRVDSNGVAAAKISGNTLFDSILKITESAVLGFAEFNRVAIRITPGATAGLDPHAAMTNLTLKQSLLSVEGTAWWTGESLILERSVLDIQGTFYIETSEALMGAMLMPDKSAVTIGPSGLLTRTANAPADPTPIGVQVTNQGGTVNLANLSVEGFIYIQISGTTQLAGSLAQGDGSIEKGALIQGGTLDLGGKTLTVGKNQTIGLSGVEIRYGATLTGAGTISGDLSNFGTVQVGGDGVAGKLQVTGDFTNKGTVTIELGKAQAGSFDVITIGGKATLNGTLEIKKLAGFDPTGTDRYTILTFASRVGAFTFSTGTDIRVPALIVDAADNILDLK